MLRILTVLAALSIGTTSQALTPEELRALVDERISAADPFLELLNDPDPRRSLAAMELMLESGEPSLVRTAIDFGLLSAVPEVKRAAVIGVLKTRPTLLLKLEPSERPENFETNFREATDGTVLADGTATFKLNVGEFNKEGNCFLLTGTKRCAIEIIPTGITIHQHGFYSSDRVRSTLFFGEDEILSGETSVDDVQGSFPTIVQLIE